MDNNGHTWTGSVNVNRAYTANGLNQLTASGGVSLGYDARGNLTSSGSDSYTYSSENLLLTGPGGATLTYDPLLRLYQASSTAMVASRFVYDGGNIIGQADTSNAIGRRYVTVPGSDEIIAEYKVSNGSRNYKVLDERGSVLAATDASGNATAIDSYDEYGIPGAANTMRYQYTGQVWLAEIGLYYYKARLYSPTLGRFMQTDPIGYGDGMNWYNYVGGDPVNGSDPSGMGAKAPITNSSCDLSEHCGNDITIYGKYLDGGDDITIFGKRLDSVSLFGTNVCGNGQCTGFGAWRIEPGAIPVLGQSSPEDDNEKDIVITATKNQSKRTKSEMPTGLYLTFLHKCLYDMSTGGVRSVFGWDNAASTSAAVSYDVGRGLLGNRSYYFVTGRALSSISLGSLLVGTSAAFLIGYTKANGSSTACQILDGR